MNNTKTKHKKVFVTGASRGIGQAVAKAYVEKGWAVFGCSRNPANSNVNLGYTLYACDIANPQAVKSLAFEFKKMKVSFDALINCAGIAGENTLDAEKDDALWQSIIDTNLNGTYYVCKYFLPLIKKQKGRIITIGSVLSHFGVPEQSAYTAAKHGVYGFTRSLAKYLAKDAITVNMISPGWTRTDMLEQRKQELGLEDDALLSSIPLNAYIEPKEIAETCLFLCSDAAQHMTGQSINICGGVL